MSRLPKFIPASLAYKEFRIPRSVLRELADSKCVARHEKKLQDNKVMILYSVKDIENYLNEQ